MVSSVLTLAACPRAPSGEGEGAVGGEGEGEDAATGGTDPTTPECPGGQTCGRACQGGVTVVDACVDVTPIQASEIKRPCAAGLACTIDCSAN